MPSRTKPKGTTRLGRPLITGPVDVKALRQRVGMSQAQFAAAFALNPRTLQQWEQHISEPEGAVRAYLTVIDRDPAAVAAALHGRRD